MKRTRHFFLPALSVVIIGLIVVESVTAAQSASGLVIQVLEANAGENLTEKELPPLKVRVMDRTGRVIPGARVSFAAPEEGPTGLFMPNSSQITVTSDTQGLATAPRFRTNSKVGEYEIEVVASYRDSTSRAVIPQTNVFKLKSSSHKKFVILSAVIGGAAAAAFASRKGSSGPASTALGALAATPTITLGGGSPVGVTTTPSITGSTQSSTSTTTASTAVATTPSSTTTSPTTSAPTVASPSSPTMQTPITQTPSLLTPAPVTDPCAAMPSNSNKKGCR